MTGLRVFGFVLRLVPAVWRTSVERDLLDEAAHFEHDSWWLLREAFVTGGRLRWEFWTGGLRADARYAVRSLRHAKAFSLGALCIFAGVFMLDIAVFASVDRALFRPLPYGRPDELYAVVGQSSPGRYFDPLSLTMLTAISSSGVSEAVFTNLTVTERHIPNVSDDEVLTFIQTTPNTLSVLGVRPVLGRDFTADDLTHPHPVVLLSYSAWQRAFRGAVDVVGQTIDLGSDVVEVAGVLPADFVLPRPQKEPRDEGLWVHPIPRGTNNDIVTQDWPTIRVPPAIGAEEMERRIVRLAQSVVPVTQRAALPVQLVPVRAAMNKAYAANLWGAVGAAAVVWLLGCRHLARLFLVRMRVREPVTLAQLALGAEHVRLVRSAITEVVVLAGAGAVAGLGIWWMVFGVVRSNAPPIFSVFVAPALNIRVASFAVGLAAVSAMILAAVVTLRLPNRVGGPAQSSPRGEARVTGRWLLLITESAVGVAVVAAGLVNVRSTVNATTIKQGFDARNLQELRIFYPKSDQPDAAETLQRATLSAIRALPAVEGAVLSNGGGMSSSTPKNIRIAKPLGTRAGVGGGYFELGGIAMLAGRSITDTDVELGASVAVLSREAASIFFPGVSMQRVVGQTIQTFDDMPRVVIGVADDIVWGAGLDGGPTLYAPFDGAAANGRMLSVILRTRPGTRLSYWDVHAQLAAHAATPSGLSAVDYRERSRGYAADYRFRAALFGVCGAIASLLLALGLYTLAVFEARARVYEFAVRAVFGASRGVIQRVVLRETLLPLTVGIPVGFMAAWWLAPFMQPLLFRIDARDPMTLTLAAALVFIAAAAAALGPARRAGQVDVVGVLKQQ